MPQIVYLDQNKWIDLARAAVGHRLGFPFQGTLEALREAVMTGRAEIVLSAVSIMETAEIGRTDRRNHLADITETLWSGRTIAPYQMVWPAELEAALRIHYGLPQSDVLSAVFGTGMTHALGERLQHPQLAQLDPEFQESIYEWVASKETLIDLLRRGVTQSYRAIVAPVKTQGALDINQNRVRARNARADKATLILHNQRLFFQNKYLPCLMRTLIGLGIDPEVRTGTGCKPGSEEFLMSLPSIRTWITTSAERDYMWDRPVVPNDLRDQAFLSTALPYCDIIVLERYFQGIVERSWLAADFGTTVLTDLAQLPGVL
jgi:hypothetical protein